MTLIPNLYLKPGVKNVSVMLSGGADSTIIYYALCDYYKDKDVEVYPMTLTRLGINHNSKIYVERIIDWVADKTGYRPPKHLAWVDMDATNEPADLESRMHNELCARSVNEYGCEVIYKGLSMNYDPDVILPWLLETKTGDRLVKCLVHYARHDTTRDPLNHNRNKPAVIDDELTDAKRCSPFIQLNKDAVVQAYKDYGVLEELYPLTMTCILAPPLDRFEGNGHCGWCFPCIEREYAFGYLGPELDIDAIPEIKRFDHGILGKEWTWRDPDTSIRKFP